ncbi:hypothetical protein FDUTEX481_02795 [Tolypothrix sp. PCC 7601]|nr:hypothetical protein FDUTEX481_02795 [Tolypothrix sp. PCC 7601]
MLSRSATHQVTIKNSRCVNAESTTPYELLNLTHYPLPITHLLYGNSRFS